MTPLEQPPVQFPFARFEGTPTEVGRSHGRTFGEQIHRNIARCRAEFDGNGFTWQRALSYGDGAFAKLSELDPDLAAELGGIAEGAEADMRDIATINIRTSLKRMIDLASEDDHECTTTAALPGATADQRTLLAQNFDQRGATQENIVVIEQHLPGQPALLFVAEAGMLFSSGMNDAGIGVVGNALRSELEGSADSGMPSPVARRRALRETSLAAARSAFEATPRAHSGNHLFADAAGSAVDLEAVPGNVFAVDPVDGVLSHSNHFLSEEAASTLRDRGREAHPDTLYRDCRVRDTLGERRGAITVDDVVTALKDHHGYPKSVCRHAPDPTAPTAGWTVVSMVMDLTDRRMWVAPGPACIGTYTDYAFS